MDKDYVKSGKYEVEIAGVRYPVEVKLNSAAIPKTVEASTKQTQQQQTGGFSREGYEATRHD